MSSGPQWVAEQAESDRLSYSNAKIVGRLGKLQSMGQWELVDKFDSVRRNLKTLDNIRLSRVEAHAFNEILKFLEELGV